MQRLPHVVLIAAALTVAVPLAGCESINNFDPSDWVPGDIFNAKKKLAGERKPVFPEGVPGLARGVPPELLRDQPQPGADIGQQDLRPPAQRAAVEPEPKARPKARPKAQPKQATAPQPSSPTPLTVRPAPQSQQPPVQWPDPPGTQRAPSAPGGVQWPDPPPPR